MIQKFKQFESIGEYYFELSNSEIRDLFDPIDSIEDEFDSEDEYVEYILTNFDIDTFDDFEFNFIKNLFDGYGEIIYADNAIVYKNIITVFLDRRFSRGGCRIDKLKDEWYLVRFDFNWWKCDQLDGVKKCVEDNILNKKS